ncbi:MAG: hypothetical protein GOVbin7759_38 [Prokaryotic dsDNA virus sp.]|jgi:hypothetical protein|nr:MAG: hypothetical protein GOVbin7759_38 [Prokaryotic dsDNA virus sp.]|tara:strand:+ start:17681 stop:18466 length:786 start_codon:yes stop_codon:yes gene_type:complete
MSILETISKPADRAPILTICGDAGTGKTSLAATFPAPIFIRAEDGLQAIPKDKRPDAFPPVKDSENLFEQMMALGTEDHEYSTLVIDSVSKLEEVFIREILAKDQRAKGINQALGGYGNGPAAVAAMHSRVRKLAGRLNEVKGMAVVFIAHADIETMRPPDMDDYTRHSLRLMPKSLPYYVDDVDLVGFVRLTSVLRGDEDQRKKVISDGSRELVAYATAASVAKNRFGITEPLDFDQGTNPLEDALGITARKAAAGKGEG